MTPIRSHYRLELEYQERAHKKLMSHNQLTPSEDFTTNEYGMYLEYASPSELERNIVSRETYAKISLGDFSYCD